jgi:predicted MFS family arabinose efflux permease
VIGILPKVSEAFGITIDRAGWLLSGFALAIALLGPWMTLLFSKVNDTAGFLGTLAAGWFMGLHLSATASGFMALFAPTLLLIFLFGQNYPIAVALVVLWGFVHAAAIPLCQALVLRAAPEAPEFSNSLFNSSGKSRFDGRNDDWRTIHCLVWNPPSAARQHRAPGRGRCYFPA